MLTDLSIVLHDADENAKCTIERCHQVMANASSFFRTVCMGTFQKTMALRNDGIFRLPLPETDAGAMKVLCDIFHL